MRDIIDLAKGAEEDTLVRVELERYIQTLLDTSYEAGREDGYEGGYDIGYDRGYDAGNYECIRDHVD